MTPNQNLVWQVSQLIIAVIVVGGGMVAILTGNAHSDVIAPIMGLVVGFYFGVMVPTSKGGTP